MANESIWSQIRKAAPALALTVAISTATAASAQPEMPGEPENNDSYKHRYIQVQLLGMNDFHGQLNVTRKVGGKEVGRADYLAAYLKQQEKENKNTLIVHAGDMVGASAPVSALLQDEPTIEFLNEMGVDVGTLGNHEFDEGVAEMKRLIYGGTHPKTGYFEGAEFPYVVANVIDKQTRKPILPPYVVKKVNGMPIGFIGVVLSETPSIVIPSGVAGVEFTDEAEAINKAAAKLKARGVHALVVLAHNPGSSNRDGSNAAGEVVEIAKNTDPDIDVIFGGHNHAYLNANVNGKLLVQSYSYGTAFSDVDLEIDPRTKDIVSKKAEIVTTYHEGIQPDPEITEMIQKYEEKVAPIVNQVVGTAENTISAAQNAAGESALGNLIADGMRKEMKTDFAFMNPGGIRADIQQGEVTRGELFTVQPFNNELVTITLNGGQVRSLLNEQWAGSRPKILQISGLSYTWDDSKPAGDKVQDIFLPDGTKIDPNGNYSVTVNSFMAAGGDNYTTLLSGTGKVVGPMDIDALVNYVKSLPQPFTYVVEGRITKL